MAETQALGNRQTRNEGHLKHGLTSSEQLAKRCSHTEHSAARMINVAMTQMWQSIFVMRKPN